MEGDCTRTLLITANVGSIFEEPDSMFPGWLKSFFKCIQTYKPGILALHCQEVGGKNYEASMQHVNQFVKILLSCEELNKYDRARIFLDEDYTAADKFTALGNLYFIHEDVSDVLIWDFVDCKFIEVEGREVLSGNIENVPIKEKAKFPQHFFPEFKWSRKGFLRTRWSVNNCIFDLINIHLFHDASNIVAMESSPSLYAGNRARALLHTLQRFENDKYSKVPLFIFGDFNFRLDSYMLIKELTAKLVASQTKGKKDMVNKIEYTEEGNGKIVLTVAIKNFDYYEKHTDLFASMNKWLHQYDAELGSFRDRLYEYDIGFPPSYPFCEDVADGISYMKTRVPSWCDRVLLTHASKDILSQDPCHLPIYDLIGKDTCMGDHKPVYLYVLMKPGKGNHLVESENNSVVDSDLQQLQKEMVDKAVLSPADSRSLTPESTSEFRRPRTLSINGEKVVGLLGPGGSDAEPAQNVDWSLVNIHDYAKFEQEKYLMPDFRNSIKKLEEEGDGSRSTVGNVTGKSPAFTRKRSFKEMACKVRTMEKVLKMWPKRPRSRHHSSSSEDYAQSESDSGSRGKASGKALLEAETDRASETTSVDTASVDLSPSRSPLHEAGQAQGVVMNESNNNEDYGKKSGDAGNLRENDITLIVNSGQKGKRGNGEVILDCGLRADREGSGGCPAPSQAAAGVPGSVGVSCTGAVDVVPPMHEAPGPAVLAEEGERSKQKPDAEVSAPAAVQGMEEKPVADQSPTPPAAATPASSSTCCGYCRCVVQ